MTEENFKQQDDIIRIIGIENCEFPDDFKDSKGIINEKYYPDLLRDLKIDPYLNEEFKLKHIRYGIDRIFNAPSLMVVYSHV